MARPAQFILSRFNGDHSPEFGEDMKEVFEYALLCAGYSPKTAKKRVRECIELWVETFEDGKIWVHFPVPSLTKKFEK